MRFFLLFCVLFSVSSCNILRDTTQIVGWGDSMMKGSGGEASILEIISDELDITHKNFAVGGLRSNSIGVLQGGIPFKIIFENNVVKTDQSNTLAYYNIEPINFQTDQQREGTIDSILGSIERISDADDIKKTLGYTFTTDDLKENLSIKDTVVFSFNDALKYRDTWTIIWAGRNDKKAGDEVYKTRDNIQAMIDYMGENAKNHYLVLSICNGIADKEAKGSGAHTNITRLNTVLEEAFGDHFIDVRSYMIHKAIYDMGMTPTSQDLEDIKKDCIPRVFLNDNVHFNTLGYEAAGKFLAKIIQEKGWITEK